MRMERSLVKDMMKALVTANNSPDFVLIQGNITMI